MIQEAISKAQSRKPKSLSDEQFTNEIFRNLKEVSERGLSGFSFDEIDELNNNFRNLYDRNRKEEYNKFYLNKYLNKAINRVINDNR